MQAELLNEVEMGPDLSMQGEACALQSAPSLSALPNPTPPVGDVARDPTVDACADATRELMDVDKAPLQGVFRLSQEGPGPCLAMQNLGTAVPELPPTFPACVGVATSQGHDSSDSQLPPPTNPAGGEAMGIAVQVREEDQPRESRLHGLVDRAHFDDFKRRLREEMQSSIAVQRTPATIGSRASSGGNQQPIGASGENESHGSESEREGEDIEGAEFEREEDSSDEETPEDLEMIDDSPQHEEKSPVVQYGQMNAAMASDSESEGQLLRRRFKRQAASSPRSPFRVRRRPRVLLSSSDSSSDEGSPPQDRIPARDKDMGHRGVAPLKPGADHPMPDAPSSDSPPEPEDDGWCDLCDDFDMSLEDDFFTKCMIVPRPLTAGSQLTAAAAAPSDTDVTKASPKEPPPRTAESPKSTPHPAPAAAPRPNAGGDWTQEPHVAAPHPPFTFPAILSPSIAAQTPHTTPPAPAAPSMDRCLAAAHHFQSLGVATMTLELKVYENEEGEEKKKPRGLKGDWASKCDLGNCLQDWVQPRRGCLAISTGASDIYALDVDASAGGGEAFDEMLAEHGGLPADTPWEWTGHRPGRHYLFSLSQSKAAGLLSGRNKGGLLYKGRKVGIDSRGEGGLLFVGPTSYRGLDGTLRQYEWVQEIAPDRSNLRAIPEWLIRIINASDTPAPAPPVNPRLSDSASRRPAHCEEDLSYNLIEVVPPPAPALLRCIEECVAATGDSRSRFDKLKRSPAGDMYVFRVAEERTCPYGAHHSGSNNFCIRVCGNDLLYHCSSPECCDIKPKRKIGQLTPLQSMLGGETAPFGFEDPTVYGRLTKAFVDNWAFQGDKGGSRIAAQMYADSHRLWHDGKNWWTWDGQRFKQSTQAVVRFVIMHQLSTVYKCLRGQLEQQLEEANDAEEKERLVLLLKQVKSYEKKHEVDATLGIMEGEMMQDLVGALDGNPHILNVQNGVIDLRTGRLDIHRPGYLCTKMADVAFKGLNHPTPTVDGFLADIFNNDRALIEFMQRLWGYSINGETSEEIIVFLLGSGGNGKGVCKQMLEATMGDYYGVMSKDAVVKPPGQRPPSKGAATGYLAELQGKRVAITDETSPGERVDLGLVLMMTGGGMVTSRLLYQNNVSFRFTHTPFIQTNYDPEIPPTLATKPNIQRRLIVVNFPNQYVSDDKFDETNPNHRHVDVGLKARMEGPAVREEFLTLLVNGSCAWYQDPKTLRAHPPAVQAATVAWLRRGDKLQTFLQSEHCQVDPEGTPESDKSVTWEDEFWGRFQEFAGIKIAKEELARQMREKGYIRTKRAGRFDGEPAHRCSCYIGLKCEYE